MRSEFVSFNSEDKLEHVLRTMAKEKISSAPVFEGEDYVGVVSEIGIVDFLRPKKFNLLWKKDKPSPMDEMNKIVVGQLAKKSSVILKPEQELSDVLSKIVRRPYCIPVLDSGKVVGIVREEDIISFLLKEFAKEDVQEAKILDGSNMQTEVDVLYDLVRQKGKIKLREAAKQLGISDKSCEKLAKSLAEHQLISMEYTFLNGLILKGAGNEKK